MDRLFGLELEERLSCPECGEEPEVVRKDTARKLVCNIQGGTVGENVSHLFEGLKLGLVGSLEKRSQILGRDAVWTKTSSVAKLSPYLCVQYMRFFWKATPDSADHTGADAAQKMSFNNNVVAAMASSRCRLASMSFT